MKLQIEQAIREELILLERGASTIERFVDAVGRLAKAGAEARRLTGETLRAMRKSGEISSELAARIAATIQPRASVDALTVDLRTAGACDHSAGDPRSSPASSGDVLRDRYVLEEQLGEGGNGVVFKARDRYRASLPERHQYVALKILRSCHACAERTLASLRCELHCAQSLSHANIVKVHELDRDGDVVFFTMELLDGEPLSKLIARLRPAAMRRSQAWQLMRQLGAGLQHAHERGVLHGDLKPSNVWVTRAGEVRIFDFGAAHHFARTESKPGQPEFVPLSGTPAYASCEQLTGRPADRRDDLYALACICYELLTGKHPFGSRPATLARDFSVPIARPLALTGRQWRALQKGLSWYRAGRSIGVADWLQRLTGDTANPAAVTPLQEFSGEDFAEHSVFMRAVAVFVAASLISGLYVLDSARQARVSASSTTPAAAEAATVTPVPEEAAVVTAPSPADVESGPPMPETSAVTKVGPLTISVETPQVRFGDRFVEVKVHRNQLQKEAAFKWWTEPATAVQGVDYLPAAASTWNFPAGYWSTRFYVKLLPESSRPQRAFFYVAVAQPGRHNGPDKIIRRQVWLPSSRDDMQASR